MVCRFAEVVQNLMLYIRLRTALAASQALMAAGQRIFLTWQTWALLWTVCIACNEYTFCPALSMCSLQLKLSNIRTKLGNLILALTCHLSAGKRVMQPGGAKSPGSTATGSGTISMSPRSGTSIVAEGGLVVTPRLLLGARLACAAQPGSQTASASYV